MNILPHYPLIYNWLKQQLTSNHKRPYFLGINAPQGAGKTTLCKFLVESLAQEGLKSVALSIDDFYYSRQDQLMLASHHKNNIYLQMRGYPGTHDISLGLFTLERLSTLTAGASASIPRYDKSMHQGQGDRLPKEAWGKVDGPLDIVFLEGWMLGFRPVNEVNLKQIELREINRFLSEYEAWTSFLNGFLQLEAQPIESVIEWRIEAEAKMRAEGKTGMSDEEVRRYIQLFLPAYVTFLPGLRQNPPLAEDQCLQIPLGPDRRPRWS